MQTRRSRLRGFYLVIGVLIASSSADAEGLDPITAICFKVLASTEVCGCATAQLHTELEADGYEMYESIIARALSQTNVPRNKAWGEALADEAKARGADIESIRAQSESIGSKHTLAIESCRSG